MSLSVASHASRAVADDAGTAPAQESPLDQSPQRISGAVTDEPAVDERVIVPPYMRETRGDIRTKAFFPLYFDRRARQDHARLIVPYFYKRSPTLDVDVAAGLVWSLRGPDRNTFVLPPLYTHRDGKDWAVGLLPLFGTGSFDHHFHLAIAPLLTWHDAKDGDHHTLVGPFYSFKKGERTVSGVFPLLWSRKDAKNRYTVVPPLFWHFADDEPLSKTTVVPPFYRLRRGDEVSYGLAPFFFRRTSPKASATTILPLLFHHARSETGRSVVTPLVAYFSDNKAGRTLLTPLYQRKRGDKNYDGVLPFFYRAWDDRDMSDSMVVPPFYFRFRDPANDNLTLFPLFARYQHDGLKNTWVTPLIGRSKRLDRDEQSWWVFPTFAYGWDEKSVHFNVHPLFYFRRGEDHSHLAIAPFWYDFENVEKKTRRIALFPIYWNFADGKAQTTARVAFPLYWDFENRRRGTHNTVGFPLYWDIQRPHLQKRTSVFLPLYVRMERGDTDRHVVLNTMVERSGPKEKRTGYAFHFFPLTAFGKNETSRFWSLFYGLAGYERRGPYRRITAFWIPFESGPKPSTAAVSPAPAKGPAKLATTNGPATQPAAP